MTIAMRLCLWLLWLTLVSGCATTVRPPEAPPFTTPQEAIAGYSQVLQHYVNDKGEVDFSALNNNRTDLDRYVAFIARTPASVFNTPADRLAHYLNSYNALSMYNILELGIPETHAGLRKIRAFFLRKFMIGGEERTLYQYENAIIRPLHEPRVHFALNCSARGCPALPRLPFTGSNLDAELDGEARKFFSEARNLRVEAATRTVHLSEILKFYTEDFVPAKAPTLGAYISRYTSAPIPQDYEIAFIDYDWTIANARFATP